MIRIYRGFRQPGSNPTTDSMHRDRKRIFVDLLKWDVPVVEGQYEVDQFDTDLAVYLVAVDGEGQHRGSIRLLPTAGDHILGTVFPELCEASVPKHEDIYEISRGCLSPRLRAPERLEVRNALTTAAVQLAILQEIRAYTCIADSAWFSQILSLGWDCRPLGLPRKIGRAMTGALRIDITPHTLRQLREAGTYHSYPFMLADQPEELAA